MVSRIVVVFSSLALFALVSADFQVVPHKDCNSEFTVHSLEASECKLQEIEVKEEKKLMCIFKPSSHPTIRIKFTPKEEGVADLATTVRAKFGKSTLPYSMSEYETCVHGGLSCPLAKDVEATYTQGFHVDPSYPKDQVFQVNWAIQKGDAKKVCVVFLAKISDE